MALRTAVLTSLALAAASVAAGGVVAPRIELDLSGVPSYVPFKDAAVHRGGRAQQKGEDYSRICQAKLATATSCAAPTASAFDHHEKNLDVVTRIYLVNNDGKVGDMHNPVSAVNYNLRAEYLFKYDAEDRCLAAEDL